MFEKFGTLRQFRRDESFVHSGDVMEHVGWTVTMASNTLLPNLMVSTRL